MTEGLTETYVLARRALLDALAALEQQLDALILVGAQAIYLHTGDYDEAIATTTTDGDIAVDPSRLNDDPLLEAALGAAGFHPNVKTGNPGEWLSADGISIDLLVPNAVAAGSGSRSVSMPPHSPLSTRRVIGIEGALVDNERRVIEAFEEGDARQFEMTVAGPAALLVAKIHKISDREGGPDHRRNQKDSHDVYRLLRDVDPGSLIERFSVLLEDPVSSAATRVGIVGLKDLFGSADSPGSQLAGQTVAGVADADQVTEATTVLANELLEALDRLPV